MNFWSVRVLLNRHIIAMNLPLSILLFSLLFKAVLQSITEISFCCFSVSQSICPLGTVLLTVVAFL